MVFNDKSERRKYWVGRLVKSKTKIRVNLFNTLPASMLGMVIDIKDEKNGSAFTLLVRWANGDTVPCYQYDIYSHEGGRCDKV
tara:strand:+ start:686 stop:934 length:249 start_codon:yes stop_codon:yes gene_type:complete